MMPAMMATVVRPMLPVPALDVVGDRGVSHVSVNGQIPRVSYSRIDVGSRIDAGSAGALHAHSVFRSSRRNTWNGEHAKRERRCQTQENFSHGAYSSPAPDRGLAEEISAKPSIRIGFRPKFNTE